MGAIAVPPSQSGAWVSGILHVAVVLILMTLGGLPPPPVVPPVMPVELVMLPVTVPAAIPSAPAQEAQPPVATHHPVAAAKPHSRPMPVQSAVADTPPSVQADIPAAVQASENAAPVAPLPPPPHISRPSAEYVGGIQSRLARVKHYPYAARSLGREGTVLVRITLNRDGSVVASKIETGSGTAALDEATLEMVRQAAPFSAFPDDLDVETLELVVPVQFSLQRR